MIPAEVKARAPQFQVINCTARPQLSTAAVTTSLPLTINQNQANKNLDAHIFTHLLQEI